MPQIIAQVLGARLALPLTPADVGLPGPLQPPGHGTDLPWQHTATIAAIAHLTRSDLMLPHTRTSDDAAQIRAADALLEPLRRWPSAKPTSLPNAPRTGRLGTAQVESIETLTAAFRDADNRHGGVLSRRAVVAQMSEINDLLATASYTEATGRRLFRAVADLGSVASWMSFDAGAHVSAQRLFVTAVHAASEGGDRQLGAHILQCMARQMSHLGHVEDALELIALAQYGARRHVSPGTRAVLAALHSRFSASAATWRRASGRPRKPKTPSPASVPVTSRRTPRSSMRRNCRPRSASPTRSLPSRPPVTSAPAAPSSL
ncbi:hypothetical protein [Streptomyces sp. NPDC052496]|uniref:hypothetical protein n=1 Tax=Streptomyces sp. NPDC052496 TaxID=3154951 RepID=UPI003446F070